MQPNDLDEWVRVTDVPRLTAGHVTLTTAKRAFKQRDENGLREAGIVAVVGKRGFVNLPRLLDYLFNKKAAA